MVWPVESAWPELLLLLSYRRCCLEINRRDTHARFRRVCSMVWMVVVVLLKVKLPVRNGVEQWKWRNGSGLISHSHSLANHQTSAERRTGQLNL